ncbi:60S acidic ribosomal protein P2-4-like [Durio zibethinus]|uniref:60S acidic ribosomal protein P2-4-like n=1 Tax=Durio zibethinus TaxID=66656 RepID=A0A6P6AQG2_DURZI|nr:60S acidic ribosomal protein P2-4-like [Durio zibethinus]
MTLTLSPTVTLEPGFACDIKLPTAIYIQGLLPSPLQIHSISVYREKRKKKKGERMKVVAAYLLAVLGGNTSPSADDLKDILGSVGAEAEDERIQLLLSEVKGKDITELIASGREKLASVPSGGGVAVAAAAPSAGAAAAPAAPETKKEEKVEEKEESDDDMGFSLFD